MYYYNYNIHKIKKHILLMLMENNYNYLIKKLTIKK